MEQWASPKKAEITSGSNNGTTKKSYGTDVNFLCICVLENRQGEGKELAKEMTQETGMGKFAVNGYVARPADLPKYGQLGCSGFILFDKSNSSKILDPITLSTSSFMELRGIAFAHVESILDAVVDPSRGRRMIPAVCPGEEVMLQGLSNKPELNGQEGICVRPQFKEGETGIYKFNQ